MKRLFLFLTVLIMLFTLIGCDIEYSDSNYGSKTDNLSTNTSSETLSSNENTQSGDVESREEPSEAESSNLISSPESSSKASSSEISSSVPSWSEQPTAPTSVTVWIPTNGGKKYHSKPSCSGMKNPEEVTKEEAVSLGFGPCGRCY